LNKRDGFSSEDGLFVCIRRSGSVLLYKLMCFHFILFFWLFVWGSDLSGRKMERMKKPSQNQAQW